MTFIVFAAYTLTMIGVGFALALALGFYVDRQRRQAADPLAEYETVDAPEHAPSLN